LITKVPLDIGVTPSSATSVPVSSKSALSNRLVYEVIKLSRPPNLFVESTEPVILQVVRKLNAIPMKRKCLIVLNRLYGFIFFSLALAMTL
jgi:hypothetical protein